MTPPMTPREQYEQAKRDFNNMRDDGTITPREKVEPSLDELLRQAVETMKSWTPEQREAHFEAQKKAWVAAEMAFGDEGTRVVTALASGFGDHAELAELREHRIAADLLVSTLKSDLAEAERKLAEADGLMIELADAPQPKDTGGRFFRAMSSINAYVARLNASKEAERG